MQDMVTIDGSSGEGGGQVIRSSVALAIVTGKPLSVENIRAGRAKPGLKRQHLTAVRAAREICDGVLTGDELGSSAVTLVPGSVKSGTYRFSVSTAGSAMLVLQTVLPPLLTADGPSTLILDGGTHNQWAPPFDFLQKAYLPLVNRMGPTVSVRLDQYGFYPAGGGRVIASIQPSKTLSGFHLLERGRVLLQRVRALVANLPAHIGEREVKQVVRKLNWRIDRAVVEEVQSSGPGNIVLAEVVCDHITEVFSAIGRKGVSAEKVADELVRTVRRWQNTDAPVGEFLADQLLLPLGLSAAQSPDCDVIRGGSFRTGPLSQHAVTHIDLLQTFLGIAIDVEEEGSGTVVTVAPR